MGLLVAAYGITQFLLSPLTGSLSDRYGRKTFILAGPVIFNAAKLLFALGDALWMLYAKSITSKYAMLFMLVRVMTFGLANYESVLGLYVTTRFQFTAQHIAILLTTGAIIGVVRQALLVAKIIQAFGETKVIKRSLLLTSTAYIVLLFATHFLSILLVTSIIFFAISMLRQALNTQLSKMAGNEQGDVAGMNNAYKSVGNIVGPTLAGFLFDANIFAPFIAGCCILFITFLMIVRWN
ncbi:MFS transporter [Paenibacillus alvei]|uniref:MFS transporter n=1 Tax=Paenibacillus alvei TaxID=44250 RepID=UPI0003FF637B|nr:MFS transporter [Paenibacillus alvei]